MSKRASILSKIKDIIKAIKSINFVDVDRMDGIDLAKLPLPAVFIYGGNDNRIDSGKDAVVGFESWNWEIYIEVWAKDADMEQLLSDIHSAMYKDNRLSGLADYSARYGSEVFVVDPNRRVKGILLKYRVFFRHLLGQP